MKTSNKILWISGSGLIGLVVLFLVVLRMSVGTGLSVDTPERDKQPSKPRVSRSLPLSGFTGVEIAGRWEVDLRRGETDQVVLEGPEDTLDGLDIRKGTDRLFLKTKDRPGPEPKLRASLTMAALESLDLKGAVELDMIGFESDRLSIRTDGVTTIGGEGNRIRHLYLRGKGVSELDLGKSPVTHGELDYQGVFQVRLLMAGGELKGRLKGAGKVVYDGQVSRESVATKGACKVVAGGTLGS